MTQAKLTKAEVDAILKEGAYFRLDDYALRDELCAKILATFLDGVEKLAGAMCREQVAADGLGQLHRHFPISKIHLLEAHLMRALRDDLYYWSYRVGSDTLGLPDPFYVDHLIVFRIHYPFLSARAAHDIEPPPLLWEERMRLGLAALRDWGALRSYFRRHKGRGKTSGNQRKEYDPVTYHGRIPVPARSHGPHIDTWYGHSHDGINLWLSIHGVNKDNTVILYPEMFGRPLAFDPVSMYIAPGIDVSRPHQIELRPGELLVFNPEMLHGTQVNISDETRVALTTRINPARPRFASDAPFHMEHWYCSDDLRRRKFSAVKRFDASLNRGEPSFEQREPYKGNKTVRMKKNGNLNGASPAPVCSADELRRGEKLAVDWNDAKLLLWRGPDGIRAYSRACPHIGVDLADGYHDEGEIFCPGHGIAYSLGDGRSKCDAFRLKQFNAFEKDGMIYVEQPAAK
jgi:nitrite reductase/ring-hydroxylating ferredoxin subunit